MPSVSFEFSNFLGVLIISFFTTIENLAYFSIGKRHEPVGEKCDKTLDQMMFLSANRERSLPVMLYVLAAYTLDMGGDRRVLDVRHSGNQSMACLVLPCNCILFGELCSSLLEESKLYIHVVFGIVRLFSSHSNKKIYAKLCSCCISPVAIWCSVQY